MNEESEKIKAGPTADRLKALGTKAPLQKVVDCGLTEGEENFNTNAQAKAACLIASGILYDLLYAIELDPALAGREYTLHKL